LSSDRELLKNLAAGSGFEQVKQPQNVLLVVSLVEPEKPSQRKQKA